MEGEKEDIRSKLASHLQDLISDSELYGWFKVRVNHAVWLNQLEQGRVSWDDVEREAALSVCPCLVPHHHFYHPSSSQLTPSSLRSSSPLESYGYNVPVKYFKRHVNMKDIPVARVTILLQVKERGSPRCSYIATCHNSVAKSHW